MKFGNWDESLHNEIDQIKRIANMKRIKPENVTFFPENESATIKGSNDIYNVTLDSCTCTDFSMRKLPCKHIYRLAYELGYLDDLPELNRTTEKAFKETIPVEIEHFKELYLSGAISVEKFVKIVNALKSKQSIIFVF